MLTLDPSWITCSISSLGKSSTRTQSSDQTWSCGCFGLGARPTPERKSEEMWNTKCDKNRFILSTGSFPDLLDPGVIYGIKVQFQDDSEIAPWIILLNDLENVPGIVLHCGRIKLQEHSLLCSNLALDICSHSDFQRSRLKLTSSDFLGNALQNVSMCSRDRTSIP